MSDKAEKRSPLKDKPLRQAGQSVQEEIQKILDDEALPYGMIAVFLVVLAGLEWYRAWKALPPAPGVFTFFALIGVTVTVLKFRKLRKRIAWLKLGRDGERAVGENLERLRGNGCLVFHDIVGEGFNVDHVVLSSAGIFVVETKTFSKRNGDARIRANGHSLHVDGLGDQTPIIDQAKANSRWIREVLKESTGIEFPTKPVIVFPGWYVEGGLYKDHWVISPKALPKLLEGEQERIRPDQVRLAAFHLSRFIRATA